MTSVATECPAFPMTRVCPFDPAPELLEAQTNGRFSRIRMWNGQIAWLATHYDDVQKILTDPRFSQVPVRPNYPFPSESRAKMLMSEHPRAMNQLDPPEHTKVRRMFARMLTVQKMEGMRPRVQEIVDHLLDTMLAHDPPADLFREFALELPSWVMAEMLGVPHEDHAFFQETARTRFSYDGGTEAPLIAGEQVFAYLKALVERRAKEGSAGSDIISRLVREEIVPGHIGADDAIAHIRQVLLAGHDTTANMIALGTLLLLENPDQLAKLKADPSIAKNAVEELLRYLTIPHFNSSRVAVEDVDINGHVIKAGEGVIASIAAANRDPEIFSKPNAFDITQDASRQMAFADGIHQCIGQSVARLELEVVFTTLFRRAPTLRLAVPLEEISFTGNTTAVYGLHALPVTW